MLKQCQFFASLKGCKYGDTCKFSHSNSHHISICKSYLSKKCRYGNKCKFSHVNSLPNVPTQQKHTNNKKICRLYQQNNKCRYGNKCKFLHAKPPQTFKVQKHQTRQKDNNKQRKTTTISKGSANQQICRLYLQNRCRYGNKCKYKHFSSDKDQNHNDERHIQLTNLNMYLEYYGMSSRKTADYMRSNTLYFYYNSAPLTVKHFIFIREIDDQIREYNTDILIQQNDKLSEYCCALIEGNYLFVQQKNIIYKCMKINTLFVDNKLMYKYKTMEQIPLKNYENNIELISDNYDITCTYYTIHDICICNEDRNYIMLFTLYVSVTNLVKITDIQIFDIRSTMECVYYVNKYNALSMVYMDKKLSLGQFYWFNKRALFYEEYNNKTGLGQLCVGWDSIDLYKSNRNILSEYLNGIDYLVDIIFEFVSTFNFIDKKRIIFNNISNIKIDRRNAILYVSYFTQGIMRNVMHSYKIMSK